MPFGLLTATALMMMTPRMTMTMTMTVRGKANELGLGRSICWPAPAVFHSQVSSSWSSSSLSSSSLSLSSCFTCFTFTRTTNCTTTTNSVSLVPSSRRRWRQWTLLTNYYSNSNSYITQGLSRSPHHGITCSSRCHVTTTTSSVVHRQLHQQRRFNSSSSTSTSTSSSSTSRLPRMLQNDNALSIPRPVLYDMSIAQVLGHVGFMLSIFSFSQSDVLNLRTTMLGATLCGSMFQYYRPTHAVDYRYRYQLLLFGINLYMATILYFDRQRAKNMNPELQHLYKVGDFERRGFNKVEFCKLFRIATKRTVPFGTPLIRDGTNPNIYFLVRGSIDIRKNDQTIAHLHCYNNNNNNKDNKQQQQQQKKKQTDEEEHDNEDNNDDYDEVEHGPVLLGELALLDRLRSSSRSFKDNDHHHHHHTDEFAASADAVVSNPDGVVVYEWKYDDMLNVLESEHEVTNALLAYICYDLQDKLLLTITNRLHNNDNIFSRKKQSVVEQRVTATTPHSQHEHDTIEKEK